MADSNGDSLEIAHGIIRGGVSNLIERLSTATKELPDGRDLVDVDPIKVLTDLTEIIDKAHTDILKETASEKAYKHVPRALPELLELAEKIKGLPRASSCLPDIDGYFGGGHPAGHIVCLGAFTSGGKTTTCIAQAAYSASKGHPVLYITLEISATEVAVKMHSCLNSTIESYESLNFKVVDGARTIEDIEKLVTQWKAEQTDEVIPIVILDYIQRIKVKNSNGREREVGEGAERLQTMARKEGILLFMAAQLNRESAKDEEPQIYHFRESGLIEQVSDAALLIWRPKDTDSQLNVKIGKNRWGGGVEKKFELGIDFEHCWFGKLNDYQANINLSNCVVEYLQSKGDGKEVRYVSSGVKMRGKHPSVPQIIAAAVACKKFRVDDGKAFLC